MIKKESTLDDEEMYSEHSLVNPSYSSSSKPNSSRINFEAWGKIRGHQSLERFLLPKEEIVRDGGISRDNCHVFGRNSSCDFVVCDGRVSSRFYHIFSKLYILCIIDIAVYSHHSWEFLPGLRYLLVMGNAE